MNQINSIGGSPATGILRDFAQQSPRRVAAEKQAVGHDEVEISELAAFLSRLAELPEDRARKVVDVRSAILNGTYDSDEKLEIATDRLLRDL